MTRMASEICAPLWSVDKSSHEYLQSQVLMQLMELITGGYLTDLKPLPSTRVLARQLGVSRTTVMGAYSKLVDEGILVTHERSGYYVKADVSFSAHAYTPIEPVKITSTPDQISWQKRFNTSATNQRNISKPIDWNQFRYPFIYGQPDYGLFPWQLWRDCAYDAHSKSPNSAWMFDNVNEDCTQLTDYIVQKILPRRGIYIHKDELLITLGAQQALYLIASLFFGKDVTVGMEEPGYVDARNIFSLFNARIMPLPVDENGIQICRSLGSLDFAYVTPSHQVPTGATMSKQRRSQLLHTAKLSNLILIEDDYDSEINFTSSPLPALRASEPEHVIYIGSLSKTLFPSLRLGYVVAPRPCIRELKGLRRLMIRQPPTSTLTTAGLFMARGHYDAYLCLLHSRLKRKWQLMETCLMRHFGSLFNRNCHGGVSFWLRSPARKSEAQLLEKLYERSILVEPGSIFFEHKPKDINYFRLGFMSIAEDRVAEGLKLLASAWDLR